MPIPGNSSSEGKKPTTPAIGTASAGNGSASVPFTVSTYIGKGTITYYATSNPGAVQGTSTSTPISVSGLSNGTAYTFVVNGITDYSVFSDTTSASNSVTPVAPPPPPPPPPPPIIATPPPPPPIIAVPPPPPPPPCVSNVGSYCGRYGNGIVQCNGSCSGDHCC